mmetsp:Transcript_25119/g.17782  ORF Transcript_25119/g.17782 Transcript_25119/m.17782 type:complete len:108 (+) Transcript_25119:367-690(+)
MIGKFYRKEHLTTSEFLEQNFFKKIWDLYWVTKWRVMTYYIGFCLMDVGPVASGLSFNGHDEKTKEPLFNRVESLNLYNLEMSGHIKVFLSAWNISVHKWLKYYVFM